jgi:hypothetical protein
LKRCSISKLLSSTRGPPTRFASIGLKHVRALFRPKNSNFFVTLRGEEMLTREADFWLFKKRVCEKPILRSKGVGRWFIYWRHN